MQDRDNHLESLWSLSESTSNIEVITIVFKHNQKDVKSISKLVKAHGARIHKWYPTDRFAKWNNYETKFFEGNNEEEVLLPANESEIECWTDHDNWMRQYASRDTVSATASNNAGIIDFYRLKQI